MTASSHSGPGASLSPAVSISKSPSSSYRQSVLHEIVQDLLGNSLSQYSQSYLMRLVDLTHLEHTLQQSASVTAPSSSSRNPIDENHLQKHYRELLARNIESETVSCVEILRLSPEMAYSVIFEPTNELSIDKHGVVQMVLRYVNQAGVKVTQISTFKLETTDDVYEYQRLFDEDIWISMVARDLVGELHYSSDPLQLQVQQQQYQPSTDTLAAMIQGSEGLCTLSCLFSLSSTACWSSHALSEISITKETDNLIKAIVLSLWQSDLASFPFQNPHIAQSHQEMILRKISRICRALFHLREGPLLYGPSAV
jgi:hypothetical protein